MDCIFFILDRGDNFFIKILDGRYIYQFLYIDWYLVNQQLAAVYLNNV